MTGHSTYRPTVDESTTIAAPVRHVWQAIVEPRIRARWWSYLHLDARVGGRFEEQWVDADGHSKLTQGNVVDLVAQQMLRLSWADEDWHDQTEVELSMLPSDLGTTVRVRHTGWEKLPGGAELAAEHRAGWRMHLSNLRSHCEAPAAN